MSLDHRLGSSCHVSLSSSLAAPFDVVSRVGGGCAVPSSDLDSLAIPVQQCDDLVQGFLISVKERRGRDAL